MLSLFAATAMLFGGLYFTLRDIKDVGIARTCLPACSTCAVLKWQLPAIHARTWRWPPCRPDESGTSLSCGARDIAPAPPCSSASSPFSPAPPPFLPSFHCTTHRPAAPSLAPRCCCSTWRCASFSCGASQRRQCWGSSGGSMRAPTDAPRTGSCRCAGPGGTGRHQQRMVIHANVLYRCMWLLVKPPVADNTIWLDAGRVSLLAWWCCELGWCLWQAACSCC